MSLVWFHRVLIGTAIVFFLGFAVWQLQAYFEGGGTSTLFFGLASGGAAIGLLFYLQRLRRFLDL